MSYKTLLYDRQTKVKNTTRANRETQLLYEWSNRYMWYVLSDGEALSDDEVAIKADRVH